MRFDTAQHTPPRRGNPLRANQSDDADATARYWAAIKKIVDAAPPASAIPTAERDIIRAILRPPAASS